MKTLGDALDFSTPAGFVFLVLVLFASLSAAGIALHRAFTRPAQPPNVIPYRKQATRRPRRALSRYRTVLMKYRTPLFLVVLGLCAVLVSPSFSVDAEPIVCHSPDITDGDTFRCSGQRIRLASIDAPEMPGHCRPGRRCVDGDPEAAKSYLESLTRGRVTCRPVSTDHYGRTVARCESDGRDLSCAMVEGGHAIERYGSLSC